MRGLIRLPLCLALAASFLLIVTNPASAQAPANPGQRLPVELVFRFVPMGLPLADIRITSLYGMRNHPALGFNRMHRGVDFAAKSGTPVYATAAGVVRTSGSVGTYGNLIEVEHALGYSTRYGHLATVLVKEGNSVDRGTLIGEAGATGRVTGPHLHYEILKRGTAIDPVSFIISTRDLYERLR